MNIFSKDIHGIYFVGIKGIAMAALAVWAKEAGYKVSGSDIEEEFPSDEVLRVKEIPVLAGFQKKHIHTTHPDLVIYTGAHGGIDNVEVQEAKNNNIPVLAHGKALGQIMDRYKQISVAGCHGKTTTTAMIATILSHADKDPSYAIGCGRVRGLGLPGHKGEGEYFVAEADEYITDPANDRTPRFLWQHPEVLVMTNIDYDHPDAYKNILEVEQAFALLANQQKGQRITIMNADDEVSKRVSNKIFGNTILWFGYSKDAQYVIDNVDFGEEKTEFTLKKDGAVLSQITLHVPGKHNVLNAAASALACFSLGLSWEQIKAGLQVFGGTKRRFEKVGKVKQAVIYDDYAHHPKEITATLAAAKAWYPHHRVIVVFQPHTYSRTKALMGDFSRAFSDASTVLLTDIYASARETEDLGINGQMLADQASQYHTNVLFTPSYTEVKAYLEKTIHKGDVVIFMGAGSIFSWSRLFVKGKT